MIKDGWYHCPVCGGKIMPITPTAIIINQPLYCKRCKEARKPTIINGRERRNFSRTEQSSDGGRGAVIQITY